MTLQQNTALLGEMYGRQEQFGTLLKMLRMQWRVTQEEVINHLPGWSQTMYTRLEGGKVAPAFDQLLSIYAALRLAGIEFTLSDRRRFIELARQRIEGKKTHLEHRSDADWAELRYQLARVDHLPDDAAASLDLPLLQFPTQPLPADVRHLMGREEWHTAVLGYLQGSLPKKLVVIQGPMGIGKSSELNRLARQLMRADGLHQQVILCELPRVEPSSGPEVALDLFLATVLADVSSIDALPTTFSLDQRMAVVLAHLEKMERSLVVLIDNGESMLDDGGSLSACWEHFLAKFLRSRHQATIFLATREWPGWYGRQQAFVTQTTVPPLPPDKGVMLLQQLGLERVPVRWLQEASEKVGGVPLGLEWVATLAKNPLDLGDWDAFDLGKIMEGTSANSNRGEDAEVTQALLRLLTEPHIFGGALAAKLHPLLEKIISKHLTPEARRVLEVLAVSHVPLAKPALKVLCERPSPIRELRCASLLVAYPDRVQLLPMVVAAVIRKLSPQRVHETEQLLTAAYSSWLQEGILYDREKGKVVTELAVLLLKHQRLFEAAQLLIRYGWLSFNLGYTSRLARLAQDVMQQFDWRATEEGECGGLLLYYFLSPFLGETINAGRRVADCHRILDYHIAGKVLLHPVTEVYLIRLLMVYAMSDLRFQEAQELLEACCDRLESLQASNPDLKASLLELRALLSGRLSERAEEQEDMQTERAYREQSITLYRHCCTILSIDEGKVPPLESSSRKRRLARFLNSLGYHLDRIGKYEEALQVLEQSIALKEQGYVEPRSLASSYGEKAQALAGLGRYQEALRFDEKALMEVERLAYAGDTLSQEERWTYLVERGRLYLQLGRVDEAEQLLQEALDHIHPRRRIYQMRVKKALEEIAQGRLTSPASHYQLDWRWVERYRRLSSFNSLWWLAQAGPFTTEEQRDWDHVSPQTTDESAQQQLEAIVARSRQRELMAAIEAQREPHLWYPALDIEDVRSRIEGLLQLDAEIGQNEPNAIVCGLYHEAIEEQVDYLHLIEATHQGDSNMFRECNERLYPPPTVDEMNYTLARVGRLLRIGLQREETASVSQRILLYCSEQLQLPMDLSSGSEEALDGPLSPSHPRRTVKPETARRFFEAALHEHGFQGWHVLLDYTTPGPRVESGLRRFILPNIPLTIDQVRDYVSHELGDHISSAVAGERSPLGLLGIGTKGSLVTGEGLALFHERRTAALLGKPFDESRVWLGTLATGLASGVLSPPQTFLQLFEFFEPFLFLYRQLNRPDEDTQTAQEKAHRLALVRCLRTYRGVPDLEQAGLCSSKDAVYLRGLRMIESAVASDEAVLDRLTVGKVALEQLPALQELGIVTPLLPLKRLAHDPNLDSYILSFEEPNEHPVAQE